MRLLLAIAAIVGVSCSWALAENATCQHEAKSKKLEGRALSTFLFDCKKDAHVRCYDSAAKNRLVGSAKNHHIKTCVLDRTGS